MLGGRGGVGNSVFMKIGHLELILPSTYFLPLLDQYIDYTVLHRTKKYFYFGINKDTNDQTITLKNIIKLLAFTVIAAFDKSWYTGSFFHLHRLRFAKIRMKGRIRIRS